jgi:hypothetical protein
MSIGMQNSSILTSSTDELLGEAGSVGGFTGVLCAESRKLDTAADFFASMPPPRHNCNLQL